MERALDGGLLLRRATEADIDAIVALGVEAFGASEEPAIREMLANPAIGPHHFTVVADGDRVVSSLCLLPETLRMGDVELPSGQVEYVVTAPDCRGRGLVRAKFDVVHGWSAERGDLVTMVAGIPYYYRRLGYEYALGWPDRYVPRWAARVPMPDGWEVRTAVPDDVDALITLHERVQSGFDLVRVRTRRHWRFLTREGAGDEAIWVAEHAGAVKAAVRVWREGERWWLIEPSAEDLDGARALLAAAVARLPPGMVAFSDRPGTAFSAVAGEHLVRQERSWATYARVPDPVAFLARIRRVLSARLSASPFRHDRGELVLSLYARGLALTYAAGEVTGVREVEGIPDPGFEGVGVPPDLLATLLLGRHGAAELARRHDDVLLGAHAGLMETLFPRLRVDIL